MKTESTHAALVLVIERDRHVRNLEQYFLEQAGYAVRFCEDGSEGTALAREIAPVMIVSEILLKGEDGLSVCRRLKADPETRHIPFLIFSVLSARDRAMEAGADAFLRKPINDRLLVDTVERLLLGGAHHGAA